jgi:hypothetical protein
MNLNNDLGYDPQAYLVFLIISRANVFEHDPPVSASGYLKRFKKQIQATCCVLEWLNLVQADKKMALGYRPSHELMAIVAKAIRGNLTSKKATPSTDDRDVIEAIFEAALPDLEDDDLKNAWGFGLHVLRDLGLLRMTASGDFAPTGHLRELAAERRQQERGLREEHYYQSL